MAEARAGEEDSSAQAAEGPGESRVLRYQLSIVKAESALGLAACDPDHPDGFVSVSNIIAGGLIDTAPADAFSELRGEERADDSSRSSVVPVLGVQTGDAIEAINGVGMVGRSVKDLLTQVKAVPVNSVIELTMHREVPLHPCRIRSPRDSISLYTRPPHMHPAGAEMNILAEPVGTPGFADAKQPQSEPSVPVQSAITTASLAPSANTADDSVLPSEIRVLKTDSDRPPGAAPKSSTTPTCSVSISDAQTFHAWEALFGPSDGEPVVGTVALASPFDASKEIKSDASGKIVLVARGGTKFYEKALIVQTAGAIGMILINSERTPLRPMTVPSGRDPKLVTIPSVMISHVDGAILMAKVTSNPDITVQLKLQGGDECKPLNDSRLGVMPTENNRRPALSNGNRQKGGGFWSRNFGKKHLKRSKEESNEEGDDHLSSEPTHEDIFRDETSPSERHAIDECLPRESPLEHVAESIEVDPIDADDTAASQEPTSPAEIITATDMPVFDGDIIHDSIVNCDLNELFAILFEKPDWFDEVCRLKNTSEVDHGSWTGPPGSRQRTMKYKLSLNLKLGPKSTTACEKQVELTCPRGCRVIRAETFTPKVPYGDSFFGRMVYVLAQESEGSTHLRVFGEVVLTKSLWSITKKLIIGNAEEGMRNHWIDASRALQAVIESRKQGTIPRRQMKRRSSRVGLAVPTASPMLLSPKERLGFPFEALTPSAQVASEARVPSLGHVIQHEDLNKELDAGGVLLGLIKYAKESPLTAIVIVTMWFLANTASIFVVQVNNLMLVYLLYRIAVLEKQVKVLARDVTRKSD